MATFSGKIPPIFQTKSSSWVVADMVAVVTHFGIRNLASLYKDLSPSFSILTALITYFLLNCRSLSELVRMSPYISSVSTLHRQMKRLQPNRMLRRMQKSILRHYGDKINYHDFVWAIDDTANPKYGKNVFRSGAWHGSSGPWTGQKIIMLALVDKKRGIAIPVAYRIAAKKGEPGYAKGIHMALQLMDEALEAGFPVLRLTTDSWFDAVEFKDGLDARNIKHCGEIKSNRNVRTNPGRYVKWTSLAEIFRNRSRQAVRTMFDSVKVKTKKKAPKCAAQLQLYIKDYSKALNVVAVYNRRNGKNAFGYYASSDLSMSRAEIWEISRARWKIEVMFRDLKQHLSFGRIPSGDENAAHLSVCLPMIILVNLRLYHGKWGMDKDMTIGDMVDALREDCLTKSIDFLTTRHKPKDIERLRARRHRSRLNKKPVNQAAETHQKTKHLEAKAA